ncbi:MAG: DUF6387 family protein [Pseudomonadota bacterium]|nr:DUF6387 family protein [Pseudomonadota bacterium]
MTPYRKKQPIIEFPDWFDNSNYSFLSSCSACDWLKLLSERHLFHFAIHKTNSFSKADSEQKQKFIASLKERFNRLVQEPSNIPNDTRYETVANERAFSPIYEPSLADLTYLIKDTMEYHSISHDFLCSVMKQEHYEIYEDEDFSLSYGSGIGETSRLFIVDIASDKNKLIDEFSRLLTLHREELEKNQKRMNPKSEFKGLITNRVLQYLDLMIYSELYKQDFKPESLFAEILFKDAYKSNPANTLSLETKPRASRVLELKSGYLNWLESVCYLEQNK